MQIIVQLLLLLLFASGGSWTLARLGARMVPRNAKWWANEHELTNSQSVSRVVPTKTKATPNERGAGQFKIYL